MKSTHRGKLQIRWAAPLRLSEPLLAPREAVGGVVVAADLAAGPAARHIDLAVRSDGVIDFACNYQFAGRTAFIVAGCLYVCDIHKCQNRDDYEEFHDVNLVVVTCGNIIVVDAIDALLTQLFKARVRRSGNQIGD